MDEENDRNDLTREYFWPVAIENSLEIELIQHSMTMKARKKINYNVFFVDAIVTSHRLSSLSAKTNNIITQLEYSKIKIMNTTNNYYSNGSVILIVGIRTLHNGWLK